MVCLPQTRKVVWQVIRVETVAGESGVSLVLHVLTAITLELIISCLVAVPSPKGFWRGLSGPPVHLPRRFA